MVFSTIRSRFQASGSSKKLLIVCCCLLFIAVISALDTWFAVTNLQIVQVEKNPICRALLQLEPEGCTWFIAGKSLGTMTTLLILSLLHVYRYKRAMIVTLSISTFQLGLLVYLTLSDPLFYGLPNFALLFRDTAECIWMVD